MTAPKHPMIPINELLSGKQPKIQCLICGSGNFYFEQNFGITKRPGKYGDIEFKHNGNDDITISCQDCGGSMTAYRVGDHWHVKEEDDIYKARHREAVAEMTKDMADFEKKQIDDGRRRNP